MKGVDLLNVFVFMKAFISFPLLMQYPEYLNMHVE